MKIYKKWWFWVIIGVLFFATVSSIGSNSDNNGNNDLNDANGSNNTSNNYGMNEVVTVGDWQFTITKAENTKFLGSTFLNETTDYNFVVITLVVKNISNTEKTLWDDNMVYHRGNNSYECNSAAIVLDNGFYLLEDIGAGLSKTISVVYEITSESMETDYILVKDGYSSKKIYIK